MSQSDLDLKPIIGALWRRRYLLGVPLLLLVPLSILFAIFGPKTYIAKSLILLQEEERDNPLAKDNAAQNSRMQDRVAGLEALAKSDLVLTTVMKEILGNTAPTSAAAVAEWKADFKKNIALNLIGTDFVTLSLKGENPIGLGHQVASLTTVLLDALLAEESTLSAAQVLVEKRKAELDSAEKDYAAYHARPPPSAPDIGRFDAARQHAVERTDDLNKAELDVESARASVLESGGMPANLEVEIKEISAKVDPYNGVSDGLPPGVVKARARLASLFQLSKAIARVGPLATEIEGLKNELRTEKAAIDSAAAADRIGKRLARAVDEAKNRYADYAKRYVTPTTRKLGVLNAPEQIKVIDLPADPQLPESSSAKFAIAGVMGSLALAFGLVLVAELLDQTVRRARDFEAIADASVLARLP